MSQPALNPQAQGFLERISAAASNARDLSGIADWVISNTTHPRDPGRPWSFEDHEFQRDILNDGHSRLVCRKCSQVGLSEIVVRLQLALLAIYPSTTAIYTLPTTSFARQFTKSRIDPVIDSSALLSSLVPNHNDSSELKQIGTSFLYIRGSFGQGAAISIPADILINDEVDFSNQQALTTFASRLGHASLGGGEGVRREFSTPTVEGYGVSKTFDTSSQKYYACKCDHCHNWVIPDFFDDVVIPGFEDKTINLDKSDVIDGTAMIAQAYLRCPQSDCHKPLTVANLADPQKRQWIAKYPDREVAGYQVNPFDVPTVNPVAKTLGYITDYDRKADWVNFKVGLPYEDAETSFLLDRIEHYTRAQWATPGAGAASGCVMGVDVGKTSWVVIGKRVGARIDILYVERVKQDGLDHLGSRLQELMDWFGVAVAVVDAAPDFTTALKLIEYNYEGRVYGCYYVRQLPDKLSSQMADAAAGTIRALRTQSLDRLVKQVNTGEIQWPKHHEIDLVKSHLGHLKRVSTMDGSGVMVGQWHSTGDDHYGHALNYLGMADKLLGGFGIKNASVATLPMTSRTKVNQGEDPETAHPLLGVKDRLQ
jgi:hypothetical protein